MFMLNTKSESESALAETTVPPTFMFNFNSVSFLYAMPTSCL